MPVFKKRGSGDVVEMGGVRTIGDGLARAVVAGIVGTAAMTAYQLGVAKVRGQPLSTRVPRTWAEAPAQIAKRAADALAFGTGVWAASYAELAPLGIYEPPWRYPPRELALDLSYHLVYGVALAGAYAAPLGPAAAGYDAQLVFDALSDKLQGTLGDLRKTGRLDDEAISRAMREIRLALLEADVNFTVVRDFVAHVRERAVGEEVLKSLTPGQQVVKIVHDELTALMGEGASGISFGRHTVILLAGLQGSGKTTTAAKLALLLRDEGRKPGLVAADLQRPAAIDQLEQLGAQIDVPVYRTDTSDAVEAARSGLERARADGLDTVIVDTAGRLQIDEELMEELGRVRDEAKPHNVLLVVDAMTGQEAVNVAQAFDERIAFDGVVLTKLDGDARGGAALSVKAVTGKPIKFASTGEKLDALEVFHPDRMASRILGMGDVLTLIERAEAAVAEDDQAEMEKRLRQGQFTFDDFLKAYKMLRRMGPLKGILKMIPGLSQQLGEVDVDDRQMARVEAIVLSMTPHERRVPHAIDGKRRVRIARGSGTTVEQVNQLLEGRKQMEKMMKQMGRGKMPALPNPGAPAGPPAMSRRSSAKRKKKKAGRR